MKDDLNKAEQEWANRSLFRPRRRRGRWVWIVMLFAVAAILFQFGEQLFTLVSI